MNTIDWVKLISSSSSLTSTTGSLTVYSAPTMLRTHNGPPKTWRNSAISSATQTLHCWWHLLRAGPPAVEVHGTNRMISWFSNAFLCKKGPHSDWRKGPTGDAENTPEKPKFWMTHDAHHATAYDTLRARCFAEWLKRLQWWSHTGYIYDIPLDVTMVSAMFGFCSCGRHGKLPEGLYTPICIC